MRDIPGFEFVKYERFILEEEHFFTESTLNQEFRLILMSLDNLVNFVEQNKKIDEFKSYLKKIILKPELILMVNFKLAKTS